MSTMSRVLGARFLRSAAKAAPSSASSTSARSPKQPTGIMKPLPVSPAMKKFLGVPEISRSGAIKKVWEHVKLHHLQNPANKREIYCDEKLKAIFDGKDKVGMLEISKLLSPHFLKSK